MKSIMKWYCPVCGFDLTEFSHDKEGTISDVLRVMEVLDYEICPCCGVQFGIGGDGLGIDKDREFYRKWRQQWINGGMKWWGEGFGKPDDRKPQNWNPKEQLKNIPKEFLGTDEAYQ